MKIKDFIGNKAIVQLLSRGQLPPTSLFTGLDGIGKKTLALSLAAFANCKNRHREDLCGECSSCVKSTRGQHPDIQLLEPQKGSLKIETMREFSHEVQFRPFEGRSRFFIIDQAETMTEEAAHSILKTIEEPPASSKIVLISAFPYQLLDTIRSRCQIFRFRPLRQSEVQGYLKDNGPPEKLEMAAAYSECSIARSLELDLETTLQERDLMLKLLSAWRADQSFTIVYQQCERTPLKEGLKNREQVERYLYLLQVLGEDLYFMYVNTPHRVINRDRIEELEKLSRTFGLNWIMNFLYHVGQSKWEVGHYVNPLMCFETLWIMSRCEMSNA
ncbi:MAG: DNA polymerase III subunit delta' [Acidobacteriota bacterium]|nr:DNA polymerase III subunit delta' [Acidobacteriota bacterium]